MKKKKSLLGLIHQQANGVARHDHPKQDVVGFLTNFLIDEPPGKHGKRHEQNRSKERVPRDFFKQGFAHENRRFGGVSCQRNS